MSRSNVFIEVGHDAGRRVSVGGRGCANSGWAWLNTDNSTKHDCGIRVSAEVMGHGCASKERRKKDGDQRCSNFTVELPDQTDGNCEVTIVPHGQKLRELVWIGAALCGVKASIDDAHGKHDDAIKTVKAAAKILADCEAEAERSLPRVILPGGVTMAHALACVEVCRRLATHKSKREN